MKSDDKARLDIPLRLFRSYNGFSTAASVGHEFCPMRTTFN